MTALFVVLPLKNIAPTCRADTAHRQSYTAGVTAQAQCCNLDHLTLQHIGLSETGSKLHITLYLTYCRLSKVMHSS
jgi:hypothetical protein